MATTDPAGDSSQRWREELHAYLTAGDGGGGGGGGGGGAGPAQNASISCAVHLAKTASICMVPTHRAHCCGSANGAPPVQCCDLGFHHTGEDWSIIINASLAHDITLLG